MVGQSAPASILADWPSKRPTATEPNGRAASGDERSKAAPAPSIRCAHDHLRRGSRRRRCVSNRRSQRLDQTRRRLFRAGPRPGPNTAANGRSTWNLSASLRQSPGCYASAASPEFSLSLRRSRAPASRDRVYQGAPARPAAARLFAHELPRYGTARLRRSEDPLRFVVPRRRHVQFEASATPALRAS